MEIVKLLPSAPSVVLMATLKGAYAAGTDYAPGDAVSYNGGVYVMHTDAAAGTAPTDTTKWQAINSPQAYVESIDALTLTNTTTDNTLSIDQNGNVGTDVATDGAVHIENTGNTGIGLGVYTNMDASAAATLIKFHADNAAFDQGILHLLQDGANYGLYVEGTNTSLTPALVTITDASTVEGNQTLRINSARGSGVQAVHLVMTGGGNGMDIVHTTNGYGVPLKITRSGTAVGQFIGLAITVDNAGTGNVVGIDLSSFTAGERLLKVPTDNTSIATSTTDSTGRIAIDDGAGNVRYVPYFT